MSHDSFKFVMRRCAKCGSEMYVTKSERMTINGIFPSGKKIYFSCLNCGNEIKLRSPWRITLGLIIWGQIVLLLGSQAWWFLVATDIQEFNVVRLLGPILFLSIFYIFQ